eukprot:TRINITY_DN82047_c0_g1_i1.p1 TRINITY_DN82047_c0_g1~~TRINITY_DN82047_c0_g1_i1.p1  ORF type:complete len:474 (-),score=48.25 TRINITY_DN82047_c0_g1_i1:39-1391(-)
MGDTYQELKEWEWLPPLHGKVVVAMWGAGTRWADVSAAVQKNACKHWQINYQTLGDPAPGQVKLLKLTTAACSDSEGSPVDTEQDPDRVEAELRGHVYRQYKEWETVPILPGDLIAAKWGADDCWADVTAQVQANAHRQWQISFQNLGDPAPGMGKILKLTISAPRTAGESVCFRCKPQRPHGGGMHLLVVVEAWDGETINLPIGSVGAIEGCSYGVGDVWVDPSEYCQPAPDGSLSIPVGPEHLGGDPVLGVRKSLRVQYGIHESRQRLADESEWEVYEGFGPGPGLHSLGGGPGRTQEDIGLAKRRCLLLGCGGFHHHAGSVNQFGEEDSPPGCDQLRFTQDEIRRMMVRTEGGRMYISPKSFVADTVWRPGNDPAPAPHIGFRPKGTFCAFAIQLRVPPEGLAPSTYYMCGGFSCGYGGVQELSHGQQCHTFSVWNATKGEDRRAHV